MRPGSGGARGPGLAFLAATKLAQQVGSGLVGHAEARSERVPGDRLAVLVLVLGGGATG